MGSIITLFPTYCPCCKPKEEADEEEGEADTEKRQEEPHEAEEEILKAQKMEIHSKINALQV